MRNRLFPIFSSLITFALLAASSGLATAQENDSPTTPPAGTSPEAGEQSSRKDELFADFIESMKGTVMSGTFTIDGDKEQTRRGERYEIKRVEKAEQGDYWNIFARMKYGKVDVTLPFPVEVKWAGKTPVITVDELKLIGMGDAFDARIVISDNKYAGTWRHGKVGGLMFGHIEKKKPAADEDAASPKQKNDTPGSSANEKL